MDMPSFLKISWGIDAILCLAASCASYTNVVQYLTARMQSVSDMENITTLISDINMDGCLNLDLMENDLNDLNLIKGVILEEWM